MSIDNLGRSCILQFLNRISAYEDIFFKSNHR